jgi:hypothetical protein
VHDNAFGGCFNWNILEFGGWVLAGPECMCMCVCVRERDGSCKILVFNIILP